MPRLVSLFNHTVTGQRIQSSKPLLYGTGPSDRLSAIQVNSPDTGQVCLFVCAIITFGHDYQRGDEHQ